MSIFYDLVSASEIGDAHKIELQGYPEDEAGSLETFRYRQSQAPDLFLGAYVPTGSGRRLIGYICSTLSPDTTLTHASMSKHVPGSSSVCIHSVCVAPEYRRQKVGLGLLKEYVSRLSSTSCDDSKPYARILLIAHQELRSFYEQAGFEWVGRSAVVHGPRPWFEMRKEFQPQNASPDLAATSQPLNLSIARTSEDVSSGTRPSASASQEPAQAQTQTVPPGLWEALQRQSSRARPVARPLTSFPNAAQDVVSDADAQGPPSNKHDLLCPRLGCGSVILKAGAASWVERASVQLDPPAGRHALPEVLGRLPDPPATAQWWLVRGSAMAFENIGFSRPVQQTAPSGGRMKLLACAECDLGPLGWCEEGGTEFWLASNRVGYRA
ncbi:acyl-CoA N-acyltransferase [Dichomitus squalens LYAD-421 SS1]|uniref:acyl-CoA N-acyltransferase n=1 Tax=Dichomitus squalens (strain LYAD-421) TaxID=732165 RepID=UPI0004410D6C|nr:acyl-CoA N-acyltransferase [Dichomitus squalens LYAD-421 SS1]EJF63647.1 acyl-CoA N-acyltransferase [Dichomitus squalens LYAD-421 SS1]